MIEKFELKEFPTINSLHDCKTDSFELLDNKLIFYFNREGLDIIMPDGNKKYVYDKLKLTYLLKKDCNEIFLVKNINHTKLLRKNIFKYWSIKQLLSFLYKKKYKLRFHAQYFNREEILLKTELITGDLQVGNEFEFQFFVGEIVYEWE